MNPAFEMEMPVEEAAAALEAVPDMTGLVVVQPTDLQPYLDACDRRAAAIPKPFDDSSLLECGLTIQFYKETAKMAEGRKAELTEENKDLLATIKWWGERATVCKEKAKGLSVGLNEFIYERQQAAIREQQRLNALAEQERLRLERERREAEQVAQAAAAAGNLEVAAVAEAKAQELAVQADFTVPDVTPVQSKTLDLGCGVTLSGKAPEEEWKLTGWDKAKPLRVTSPLLKELLGDLSKLPDGVQFVLKHADLNPVHLNATFKGGALEFPKPFTKGPKFGGSVLRGSK